MGCRDQVAPQMTRTSTGMRANVLLVAALGVIVTASVGCSPLPEPDVGSRLMGRTTAGQNRSRVAKSTLNPFVIEWDPTDLSAFETHATRDVVFVRYDGQEIEMLWGCRDPGVPGKYGSYGPPAWSSGALQDLELRSSDDLNATVPLSAALLEANVSRGESLKLVYFVSGMISSTRETIARANLVGNDGCKTATHYVWRYNLGAFELRENVDAAIGGGARVAGVGAHASRSRGQSVLKRGGSLAECETDLQTRCRIPIRLALKPLQAGPPGSSGDAHQPGPKPGGSLLSQLNDEIAQSPEHQALELVNAAREKLRAGDGNGCLADLGRAESLDGAQRDETADLRARCEMRAGQCEQGKRRLLQFRMAQGRGQQIDPQTTAFVSRQVDAEAETYGCLTDETRRRNACQTEFQHIKEGPGAKIDEAWLPLSLRRLNPAVEQMPTWRRPSQTALQACIDASAQFGRFLDTFPTRFGICPRAAVSEASSYVDKSYECFIAVGRCRDARVAWTAQMRRSGSLPAGLPPQAEATMLGLFDRQYPECQGK